MAIEPLGYRPWSGPRRTPRFGFWAIARSGMGQVLKRKVFWVFLAISLLSFLFYSSVIYLQAEVQGRLGRRIPPGLQQTSFLFTGKGEAYLDYLLFQGHVVMLMLALSGSILVGNDFHTRAIPFYLSKPIGRLDYFLGKFLAVSGLAALITLLPAVVLFLEYGAFTESFTYWRENLHLLGAIVLSGTLVCVVPSALLLGISSLFKRTVPILLAWAGIFVFLPTMVWTISTMQESLGATDAWSWLLIDLWWADLKWIAHATFGIDKEGSLERWPYAAAVVVTVVLASVLTFWRRISAVEVVR